MKKILVSGASGIVGYGILRSLRKSGLNLQLIGTSVYEDSVAPAFSDVFEKAPLTKDGNYISWLLDTIGKHKIDLIIPGIEADMQKWSEHISEIENSGAKVLLNKIELIALCKDKWKFYEYLVKNSLALAIESSLSDNFNELTGKFGLPFLLKPRMGFGSKGIVRVDSEETFLKHKVSMGVVLMAQPIMGTENEEYTTSAFCDGKGGYFAFMTLKRKLAVEGFTEKAEVVNPEGIEDALRILCGLFQPIGPTNFQFRKHEGKLKLLEINPRISSATSIRTAFGYNESQMAVDFFLENKTPVQPEIKKGKAVRFTEDYIFYL